MNDRKLSMEELGRTDAAGYRAMRKRPFRFVLDDVRSRHNVGSIFRTADAFGFEAVILCGFTPSPPHREIEKTALGATLSVPWEARPDPVEVVRTLVADGYAVWCLEQTLNAVPLQEWRPGPGTPVALVLGNELSGVSDAVISEATGSLIIPQAGTKHSLNVSVCAGIAAWHVVNGAQGLPQGL